MKKLTSFLLIISMILSVFAMMSFVTVAALTVVSDESPVIKANIGDVVVFDDYSVTFSDGTSGEGLTWKNSLGEAVSEFIPFEKGATKFTVTDGMKTTNVYVVAKDVYESDYVLFETDFSEYKSLSDMKNDGWTFMNADGKYSLDAENGFVMGASEGINENSEVRAILPAWLGEFGDYSVSADVKMLSAYNDTKWFALVYRIQDINAESYYPYYQMCVRKNTSSNGIEFTNRAENNVWNVLNKTSGMISDLSNGYHSFNIKAYGSDIRHSIDGIEVQVVDNTVLNGIYENGTSANLYEKGKIGLTTSYASISVKKMRVTLLETKPSDNNLKNHIANIQSIPASQYNTVVVGMDAPENVFVDITASDAYTLLSSFVKYNVIPTFEVDTTNEVNGIAGAMESLGTIDVNIVSRDPAVLAYASTRHSDIRRGLILTGETIGAKTAHELRVEVRKAPATFCVIPSEYATKEFVYQLQELCVSVWSNITSAPNTDAFVLDTVKSASAGVNGIISKSASAVNSAINNNYVENAMTRTSIMIGHRGNPGAGYVGNSMSSFKAAYENGADVLEIDVERTLDGVPVIAHADSDFADTTTYNGTKKISEATLAEIQQYCLNGTTEPIPTLLDVIEEFKDKDIRIFLEFKNVDETVITVNGVSMTKQEACVKSAMEIIVENGCEFMFDVISFEEESLSYTQKYLPGMSTGFLCSPNKAQWIYPYLTLDTTTEYKATNVLLYDGYGTKEDKDEMRVALQYNSTINPSNGDISAKYFEAAADRGMSVWPWTYYPARMSEAFLGGCDGITTDYVHYIKNMAKFAFSENISLDVNSKVVPTLISETYGGEKNQITLPEDIVISVVSGGDVVRAQNGEIFGLKEGTATVILGYRTKTHDGFDYVLYTEPVTVTVKENQKESLSFTSVSLTINSDITTNYKVSKSLITEKGYESPYVVFEMNGIETTVTEYTVEDDKLVFGFENIAPHEMNDTVVATLYATKDGALCSGNPYEYCIKQYCYNTLSNYSDDTKLRTLIVDLLNYGAKTQEYIGYKTDLYVNSNLTSEQKSWGTSTDRELTNVMDVDYETVDDKTVIWESAGLILNRSVGMRFKIKTDSIDGLSVKAVSGEKIHSISTSEFVIDENGIYFDFEKMSVAQMSDEVYFTVYKNGMAVSNTLRYSIESYAEAKLDNEDETLVELVKAMMRYGDSAKAYITQ